MTWVIGDIHGCIDELSALLDRLPSSEALVFVGDYIDRGPDSRAVVDRLLEEKDRSVFLMGNHEAMLYAFYFEPESDEGSAWLYPANGGGKTLASYGLGPRSHWEDLPAAHRLFYSSLKLFHEEQHFLAVHAGLRVSIAEPEKQNRTDLLWIRNEWIKREKEWTGKHVVYGHTPSAEFTGNFQEPIRGSKSTGIDTGCVYGGYLSALQIPGQRLEQVRAHRRYI
ncbi:MAG: serine/threonine protein phosphatase [Spirochaetales bacterium]|nr:serine/threonine protein phosphatase [Spirochaetales bacterium]